jgi:hypothetical protein
MFERRPFVTWSSLITGAIAFITFAWKLIDLWSNVDFLSQKSGVLWDIMRFLFFSSKGTSLLAIFSFGAFLIVLLFQRSQLPEVAAPAESLDTLADEYPPEPQPEIDFIEGKVIDVWLEEENGELRGSMYENDEPLKAAVAEFRRQPDKTELGFIDVRASLKFWPDNGNKIIVNDACWNVGEGSQYCTFEIGDSFQLIIAILGDDKGFTYERKTPNDRVVVDTADLADESYDVDVELIGTKRNKVYIHKTFELVLTLRPNPQLGRRGFHVEMRVVHNARPAKAAPATEPEVKAVAEPATETIEPSSTASSDR